MPHVRLSMRTQRFTSRSNIKDRIAVLEGHCHRSGARHSGVPNVYFVQELKENDAGAQPSCPPTLFSLSLIAGSPSTPLAPSPPLTIVSHHMLDFCTLSTWSILEKELQGIGLWAQVRRVVM
jgi:hypothetical protein